MTAPTPDHNGYPMVGDTVEVVKDYLSDDHTRAIAATIGQRGEVVMILGDGLTVVDMPPYNNNRRTVSYWPDELRVIEP